MTEAVLIRDGVESDARALARISVDGWQQAYATLLPASYLAGLDVDARMRGWLEVFRNAQARVLVAEMGGEVAGFSSFGPSRDDDPCAPRTAEIYAIYVAPEHWRQGIGQQLLSAGTEGLRLEADAVTLWVLAGNAAARRFYAAQAFEPDGATKVDHRNGIVLDEVRYRRWLAPGEPLPSAR